jgi:hypothetical protein
VDVRIIIRRSDLQDDLFLNRIENLSRSVVISDDRIIATPASGKIIELLHLLRDHHISYETGDSDRDRSQENS